MSRRRLFTATPVTPIEHLAAKVRDYLHMPDPSALYALVGSVAANMVQGEPVWLMLIGPPGSGKTELLNSLLDIPGLHESAHISNESAFLSATPKRERSKDATGGMLRQVGIHGGIVLNDFTSVLTLKADILEKVLGVFRESYSGRWTREVGSEGGRKLQWVGKVSFFAGCTSEIDRHHTVSAALGERWLHFRFEESDPYEKSRRVLINSARSGWRTELAGHVRAFFEEIGLKFYKGEILDLPPRRALDDYELVHLIRMGDIAARSRSAVVRDHYSKEIVGVKETEVGTRVSAALGQLLVGLELCGVPEDQRWNLLRRISLDSMPRLRRLIFEAAIEGTTYEDLIRICSCSRGTVTRAVEDLEQHEVVRRVKSDDLTRILLTDRARLGLKKPRRRT